MSDAKIERQTIKEVKLKQLKQLKQLRKGKLSEVPDTSGIENSEYSNMLWGVTYRYVHFLSLYQFIPKDLNKSM